METPHHVERHFTGGEKVRDVVIGMSDGLTVPFALAAGLTGAIAASRLVVVAGLAEIAAGSIAMGLGGYLAARSDAEHYASERVREQTEVREKPTVEADEITEIFEAYGVKPQESATLVEALKQHPEAWVDFMMRFELGLEKPEPKRALQSAVTIAASYVVGGLIPLAPYMLSRNTQCAGDSGHRERGCGCSFWAGTADFAVKLKNSPQRHREKQFWSLCFQVLVGNVSGFMLLCSLTE